MTILLRIAPLLLVSSLTFAQDSREQVGEWTLGDYSFKCHRISGGSHSCTHAFSVSEDGGPESPCALFFDGTNAKPPYITFGERFDENVISNINHTYPENMEGSREKFLVQKWANTDWRVFWGHDDRGDSVMTLRK
ncbi:uncharacterized protein DNG_01166 [Cephalotrichum gorgonifer]|uniref:Uncharacterized protein n=1 Tax=Cephalotrichum gorgonifer TaxID=2041049 RepID=A0AAE8MS47_9PEZI|nr:uncharacterized protein DNG_01166 [Cephalotrichum gorgonifer]